MKLSFSTNRWQNYDLINFFEIAKEYKFSGVEIHDVKETEATELKSMRRRLMEYGISIPCIDLTSNIAEATDAAITELNKCIEAAEILNIPYIRLKATNDSVHSSQDNEREFINSALPLAQ